MPSENRYQKLLIPQRAKDKPDLRRGSRTLSVEPFNLSSRGVNGLKLDAEEVMRCLRDGKTESAIMPLGETVSVMETLDQIRAA